METVEEGVAKFFRALPNNQVEAFVLALLTPIPGGSEEQRSLREHLQGRLKIAGYRPGRLPNDATVAREIVKPARHYDELAMRLLATWWAAHGGERWSEEAARREIFAESPDVGRTTFNVRVPVEQLQAWSQELPATERLNFVVGMFCVANWAPYPGGENSAGAELNIEEELGSLVQQILKLVAMLPHTPEAWSPLDELVAGLEELRSAREMAARKAEALRGAAAEKLALVNERAEELQYLELGSTDAWRLDRPIAQSIVDDLDALARLLVRVRDAKNRPTNTRSERRRLDEELKEIEEAVGDLYRGLVEQLSKTEALPHAVAQEAREAAPSPGAWFEAGHWWTDSTATPGQGDLEPGVETPPSGASLELPSDAADARSGPGDDSELDGERTVAPASAASQPATASGDDGSRSPESRPAQHEDSALAVAGSAPASQPPVPASSRAIPALPVDAGSSRTSVIPAAPASLRTANGSRVLGDEWQLPETLVTFQEFRASSWLTVSGQCRPAQWVNREKMAEGMLRLYIKELLTPLPRGWVLEVLSLASEKLGGPLPPAADLRALLYAWENPGEAAAVVAPDLGKRIRDAIPSDGMDSSIRWRYATFLLALTSSHELSRIERENALNILNFSTQMESAVGWMLETGAQGGDSVQALRAAFSARSAVPRDERERQLAERRHAFEEYLRSVRHAGGGKIQRPHCRDAWHAFIEENDEVFRSLFPQEKGGRATLDEDVGQKIRQLVESHADIANRATAKLKDRKIMDRIAQNLAERAIDIYARVRTENAETSKKVPQLKVAPLDALEQLLNDKGPDDEKILRAIMRAAAGRKAGPHLETEAALSTMHEHPSLVFCLSATDDRAEKWRADVDASPHVALEALFEAQSSADAPSSSAGLFERLQETRPDVLWRLPASKDRSRLRARTDELAAKAIQLVDEIRSDWDVLDAVVPGALPETISAICGSALRLLDGRTDDASAAGERPEPAEQSGPWLVAWLEAVRRHTGRLRELADAHVKHEVEDLSSTRKEQVLAALEAGGTAAGAHALHFSAPAPASHRVTPFRRDAEKTFSNAIPMLRDSGKVERWIGGMRRSTLKQDERQVREEFLRVFLKGLEGVSKRSDEKETRVSCQAIRNELASRSLNPCYVPQLERFKDLVIPAVSLATDSPDYVNAVMRAVPAQDTSLVLVLSPRLASGVRERLTDELRRRNRPAAVIDDIDVCRLLNPGGQGGDTLLGLLEIFLEQQRWADFSPFAPAEGQLVRMEMYVGRKEEARRLAQSSEYTRVFSGRKMGKTALLKYVEREYDRKLLPSGNDLRVLYVHAVGIDEPGALVDEIIDTLAKVTSSVAKVVEAQTPEQRLERALTQFLKAHPKTSLLFVLDEADAFVEKEVERFRLATENAESTLSWAMRSGLRDVGKDQNELPRARFVFVGYRATNTMEGAWANWGSVLKLKPLPRDDARELIAGPLARLGIDVAHHADAVAHRCGYQPAVIIAFGLHLLQRLEANYPPGRRARETPTVTARDVALTFEKREVREEILTIVKNNFQQNDEGRVVFGALLNVIGDLPPGEALGDAEGSVLERLAEFASGDLQWLGEQPIERIRAHLRDFVDRELLEEERVGSDWEYRLRFPHHRPALTALAQRTVLAEDIQALRRRASGGRRRHVAIYDDAADGIRHVLALKLSESLVVPVVLVPWGIRATDRVINRSILDPLGFDSTSRWEGQSSDPAAFQREKLAVIGASPSTLAHVLERRRNNLFPPLFVGGLDLARACYRRAVGGGAAPVTADVFGPGRLTLESLGWWFNRVEELTFAKPGAVEEIFKATSGIPILVRKVDDRLSGAGGERAAGEISEARLLEVLRSRPEWVAEAAHDLLGETPDVALSQREREVLDLYVSVGGDRDEMQDVDFVRAAGGTAPVLDPVSDEGSVAVVSMCGLIPSKGASPVSSIQKMAKDDALIQLVNAFRKDQ